MAHNVGLLVGDAEVEAQHPERVEDKVFKLVAVHEEAAVATEEESVSALANTVQKVHNPGRLGRAVFRDGSMALVPLVVWLMFHHHLHLRSKQAKASRHIRTTVHLFTKGKRRCGCLLPRARVAFSSK